MGRKVFCFAEFKGEFTRITAKQLQVHKELNMRQPGCAVFVRWPNEVQCRDAIWKFDGSAAGLLELLGQIHSTSL